MSEQSSNSDGQAAKAKAGATAAEIQRSAISDGLELVTVASRPMVTLGFSYSSPADPVASVILIEGGPGNPAFDLDRTDGRSSGGDGFLVKSEGFFRDEGFAVTLMRAPSDQGEKMAGAFRNGTEHVRDAEAVIDFLKSQSSARVWLVGMSLGSGSAGNIVVNSSKIDGGAVFVSSVSDEGEHGVTPARFRAMHNIVHPVLAVAHEKDACPSARPECANDIIAKCEKAPAKEIKLFSGGLNQGEHPCRPLTYHTYFGIEQEVAHYISGFNKANSQ